MGWLERILGGNDSRPFTIEEVTPTCQFESNNNDCSLIQQLKEKQTTKRGIDEKIKAFEQHEPAVIDKLLEFLLLLESNRFEMGMECRSYHMPGAYNSGVKRTFYDHYSMLRLERVIAQVTESDLDAIHAELKSMKNRVNVLGELHQQSSALADEIKVIKAQLGIE